jgi:hypothetical protein
MPVPAGPPPGGQFLQWFASYKEAANAISDFADIIRDRYPGWSVSQPRSIRNGYALYALPPEKK